jgi:hypothetical protein
MKAAQEALDEIWQEYDACPEGWRLYVGIDSKEQFTVYAFHADYAWTIKFPQYGLNGLAEKVKIEEDELIQDINTDPDSFGLRMMSQRLFRKLLKENKVGGVKPVSRTEILEKKPQGLATGPITKFSSPIAPISQSQIALENKLNKELNKLTDGMYL